jgi:hypothetical protein
MYVGQSQAQVGGTSEKFKQMGLMRFLLAMAVVVGHMAFSMDTVFALIPGNLAVEVFFSLKVMRLSPVAKCQVSAEFNADAREPSVRFAPLAPAFD